MPEIDKAPANESKEAAEVLQVAKTEDLPAINLPQTKTPVTFSQQVNNFQQIPPSAWDGLTPEQRLDLTRSILAQIDSMDKRHYDFAVAHVQTEARRSTIGTICGAAIAVLGFSISGYLSMHGQTIVALSITMPLATILAIVVGNRFVSRP
jgi:hypothetical protein